MFQSESPKRKLGKTREPGVVAPSSSGSAARIAFIYLAAGLLWIWGSDAFLVFTGALELGPFIGEIAKGSLFVGLSALGVYLLVKYLPIRRRWLPVLVALAYLLLGIAWIFSSDFLLFNSGQLNREALWAQVFKGSAFVTISAFMIFLVTQLLEGEPIKRRTALGEATSAAPGLQIRAWRISLLFGVILLGLSLILDVYQLVVNQAITSAEFGRRVVEALLLALFAGSTLFLLLRFYLRQARRAVRGQAQSDQRYLSLFEHHPDPTYLLDHQGRFQEINEAVYRFFAQPDEVLVGRSWEDLVHPDCLERVRARFRAVLEGNPQTYEVRVRGPQEAYFWFLVTNVPQYEDDQVTGVFGIARDITAEKTAQQRITASEARFRALFEYSPDMVFLTRPDGGIEAANASAQSILGLTEDEIIERGRDGVIDNADPMLGKALAEREQSGRARAILSMFRADGRKVPVEVTTARFQSPQGEAQAFVVARDISKRLESERQRELVAAAFREADEAMALCDPNFVILDVNQAYTRLIGCERKDAIGSRPPFLAIEEQDQQIFRGLQDEGHWRGELLQQRMDGQIFVARTAVSQVPSPDEGDTNLVVNFDDLSELREYERKVNYLSYHDPLTGLPNREALKDWFVSRESADDSERRSSLALAFMNLDRLKSVNDAFGHSVGDELVKEFARRLRKACDKNSYAARLLGDDFVMVMEGVSDADEAVESARRLMETLSTPFEIRNAAIHASICVGIALSPQHGTQLADLLHKADAALHEAKRRGRAEVMVFNQDMTAEVEFQLSIERRLQSGLQNREFLLQYQPSVWLSDQRVVGLEALVRWENPELGFVRPDRFISVAEETGLIIDLGTWIFDEACRQVAEWRNEETAAVWVSINFSSLQFQDPGLLDMIRATMKRHGVHGHEIRIEITESLLVMDPDRTVEVLTSLRDMGIAIAIDDFGTGYSSLAYLKQFPVDFVKLDKSFIAGLPRDESDAHIVGSVIDLAQRLGMGIVAEGIERRDQLEFLEQAGCPEAQGYYFSPPMGAEDISWLLKCHSELPVPRSDHESS